MDKFFSYQVLTKKSRRRKKIVLVMLLSSSPHTAPSFSALPQVSKILDQGSRQQWVHTPTIAVL